MRTNVAIDDFLMESALRVSGIKTKKDTIEEALKLLVQIKNQENIKGFRGKLQVDPGPSTLCGQTNDSGRFIGLDRLFQWQENSANGLAGFLAWEYFDHNGRFDSHRGTSGVSKR